MIKYLHRTGHGCDYLYLGCRFRLLWKRAWESNKSVLMICRFIKRLHVQNCVCVLEHTVRDCLGQNPAPLHSSSLLTILIWCVETKLDKRVFRNVSVYLSELHFAMCLHPHSPLTHFHLEFKIWNVWLGLLSFAPGEHVTVKFVPTSQPLKLFFF